MEPKPLANCSTCGRQFDLKAWCALKLRANYRGPGRAYSFESCVCVCGAIVARTITEG